MNSNGGIDNRIRRLQNKREACVAYLDATMLEDTNSPVMRVPKMRGSLVCHEHVEAADYVSVTYYGIAKTYKILATKLTTNEKVLL